MGSKRNSHQRHKFLRAEASRDILKLRVFRGFERCLLFRQNTCKTGNNAVEMSQVFCDIAWFEHFTDLNLFTCKFGFNVIHKNWGTGA